MNPEHKRFAEAALRHLCVGRQIRGMKWYSSPLLLIEGQNSPAAYEPIEGEVCLTVSSFWCITSEPVEAPPPPDPPTDLEPEPGPFALAVCELRESPIVNVTLGENEPHLTLHFDNGQRLVINGAHSKYECWLLGGGGFMVVTIPGGDVAVWAPDDFDP